MDQLELETGALRYPRPGDVIRDGDVRGVVVEGPVKIGDPVHLAEGVGDVRIWIGAGSYRVSNRPYSDGVSDGWTAVELSDQTFEERVRSVMAGWQHPPWIEPGEEVPESDTYAYALMEALNDVVEDDLGMWVEPCWTFGEIALEVAQARRRDQQKLSDMTDRAEIAERRVRDLEGMVRWAITMLRAQVAFPELRATRVAAALENERINP